MTLSAVVDRWAIQLERWPVTVGYIAGAGVLSALLIWISQFDLRTLPLLMILYLGPLGLAAAALLAFPVTAVFALANSASDVAIAVAMGAAVAMATASLNVIIVKGRRRRRIAAATPSSEGLSGDEPDVARRYGLAFSKLLFALAGWAFIALSVIAGGVILLADGMSSGVSVDEADPVKCAAAVIWWPGLLIAVAGLVTWIIRVDKGRPATALAAIDLVAMLVLISVLLDVSSR
ncbi:hypothetical protein I6E68_12615 [Salinibacterium sp. NSLL150]|uniref:hypothetical protein n=1 Tax=unclassified Salinibacterium TaxID=2632331 RepID=UPI0018CEAC18|nr:MULTISPECIES: hypothetical protein [unclassified Salinibacterium]MBH0099976.1 hypothetical protein [Salinibacterium sp. NSLL35]MBH0102730.1 hypothetical protein [Salinibacterium sp. NSLL150]MBH0105490.1 hypothetical protein [Salinibacterium sp. NSLL16]MBH0108250.1 hypothetical protein [Salinibacterium sp. NSLL17]MBH0117209.1 hypothetical protein [Salinibacterium sp. NG253]